MEKRQTTLLNLTAVECKDLREIVEGKKWILFFVWQVSIPGRFCPCVSSIKMLIATIWAALGSSWWIETKGLRVLLGSMVGAAF